MSNGEGELADESTTPNEIVLDNILAANPDYEIKNLAINTEYSDFSPMYLDVLRLYFHPQRILFPKN